MLTSEPLAIFSAENAITTSFYANRDAGTCVGAVYDSSGRLIRASQRQGGLNQDRYRSVDPEIHPETETADEHIEGRTLYLGNMMGHYGHFLLETLAACWALPLVRFDRAVFHPFTFGLVGMGGMIWPLLEPLGLTSTNTSIHRQPVSFDFVMVPERALIPGKSGNTIYRTVLARITEVFGTPDRDPSRAVFMSRSRLAADRRAIENTAEVDALATEIGYEVVHSQEMSVTEQVRMASECRVMAGFSGSALHNILFAQPGVRCVEIGASALLGAVRWPWFQSPYRDLSISWLR